MAKKLPYLNLFTGDYVRDTRVLSLEARALWMDMLCMMWDGDHRGYFSAAGKPRPMEHLARFSGCATEVADRGVAEILASGVASKGDDGVIYSRRIVRDEKRRKVARRNGQLGGNPKLKAQVNQCHNDSDNARLEYGNGNGVGVGVGCDVASSSGGGSGAGEELATGFSRFWAAYPRKVAKPKAFESWRKIKPDAELVAVILAAVERQKKSPQWVKDGGEFIPHPTTWLNQRRWEDQPTQLGKASGTMDWTGIEEFVKAGTNDPS